jgi:serine/threonine-protein kinase
MIGKRIGGYQVVSRIGSGGLAEVYRAIDGEGNYAAIKMLFQELTADRAKVERFLQEVSVLERLSHKNIIRIISNGIFEDKHYIIMEYVEGYNLKDLILRKGRIDESEASEILLQIGEALDYLHKHGIIHRDIKPQNILINPEGLVKLTDFGIALQNSRQSANESEFGTGTATYMSPEQIKGLVLDERTDIYSLGVTAYEMLTGSAPFRGDSINVIKTKHLNFPPIPPTRITPAISTKMEEIVLKMLEKDIYRRYRNVEVLINSLKAVQSR